METPYFNTYLYSNISLHPSQMCNGIMTSLKENLIKKLQNRCYKSFGFITKIYNIKITKNGIIVPEDTSASALFEVKFSCKLCKPILNTSVVCEIVTIIKNTIYLKNGPINAVICITDEHNNININLDNFIIKNNNVLYKLDKNNAKILNTGMFVKIKIIQLQFKDRSTHIRVEGYLERLATESEIDETIKLFEDDDMEYIKYTDYDTKYKKIIEYDDKTDSDETESLESLHDDTDDKSKDKESEEEED
jgi:DNA-directed RNA polymerase subunit E'/Rpb7